MPADKTGRSSVRICRIAAARSRDLRSGGCKDWRQMFHERGAAAAGSHEETGRIAANIAKLPEGACGRFGRAHIIMARRRNIRPRFGIEHERWAVPIASISDIATKLEIMTAGAELFDVSDDLQRLHDQIVAFRAGESLAPEPWNWHATCRIWCGRAHQQEHDNKDRWCAAGGRCRCGRSHVWRR